MNIYFKILHHEILKFFAKNLFIELRICENVKKLKNTVHSLLRKYATALS